MGRAYFNYRKFQAIDDFKQNTIVERDNIEMSIISSLVDFVLKRLVKIVQRKIDISTNRWH